MSDGGSLVMDHREFPIHAHSLCFFRPGKSYAVRRQEEDPAALILFDRQFLAERHIPKGHPLLTDLFLRMDRAPVCTIAPEGREEMKRVLESLQRECQRRRRGKKESLDHLLISRLLLGEFLCLAARHARWEEEDKPDKAHYDELLQHFSLLLETHFRSKHKVEDYLPMLHADRKRLERCTRSCIRQSPREMIHARLVQGAMQQLRDPALSIKEVSEWLGFDDQSDFSKFFKQQTGESPSDYRDGLSEAPE